MVEREGFEPSVPVTQYARLATPRRFANGVTSARLLKTVPTMARWLGSATASEHSRNCAMPCRIPARVAGARSTRAKMNFEFNWQSK